MFCCEESVESGMQGASRILEARFMFHSVSFCQAMVCGEPVPVNW